MSTLFEITAEFNELYALATAEEVDEQVFNDTLESLTGELEVKGAGYVAVINQLDMEQKKAKELADQFKLKADVRANSIKRMKDALKVAIKEKLVSNLTESDNHAVYGRWYVTRTPGRRKYDEKALEADGLLDKYSTVGKPIDTLKCKEEK